MRFTTEFTVDSGNVRHRGRNDVRRNTPPVGVQVKCDAIVCPKPPTLLPGLDVVKEAISISGPFGDPGAAIGYQVTITNNTGEDLTDVVYTDTKNDSSPINIGSLLNGASSVHNYQYLIQPEDITAGQVTNVATATGTGPSGNYETEVTLVVNDPSL